jgi:hypothetical protein
MHVYVWIQTRLFGDARSEMRWQQEGGPDEHDGFHPPPGERPSAYARQGGRQQGYKFAHKHD